MNQSAPSGPVVIHCGPLAFAGRELRHRAVERDPPDPVRGREREPDRPVGSRRHAERRGPRGDGSPLGELSVGSDAADRADASLREPDRAVRAERDAGRRRQVAEVELESSPSIEPPDPVPVVLAEPHRPVGSTSDVVGIDAGLEGDRRRRSVGSDPRDLGGRAAGHPRLPVRSRGESLREGVRRRQVEPGGSTAAAGRLTAPNSEARIGSADPATIEAWCLRRTMSRVSASRLDPRTRRRSRGLPGWGGRVCSADAIGRTARGARRPSARRDDRRGAQRSGSRARRRSHPRRGRGRCGTTGSDDRSVRTDGPARHDRLSRPSDRGAGRRPGVRLPRDALLRAGGPHGRHERPRHPARWLHHRPRRGDVPRVRGPRAPRCDRGGQARRASDDVRRSVCDLPRRGGDITGLPPDVLVPSELRMGVSTGPDQCAPTSGGSSRRAPTSSR